MKTAHMTNAPTPMGIQPHVDVMESVSPTALLSVAFVWGSVTLACMRLKVAGITSQYPNPIMPTQAKIMM